MDIDLQTDQPPRQPMAVRAPRPPARQRSLGPRIVRRPRHKAHGPIGPRQISCVPLPPGPAALVGRDADLAAIVRLVTQAAARLVTLTGPGGVGKTALGLATAHRLRAAFANRVWFVPLDSIQETGQVLPAIARVIGGRGPGPHGLRGIASLFGRRPGLLVLDTLEHLDGGARIVEQVLAIAPALTILVTSRSPLHLSMEQAYPVAGLSLDRDLTVGESVSPAVALFIDRARACNPTFAPAGTDIDAITGICRRLDGLPLATHLVAGWTKLYTPRELAARLDDPMRLLRDGPCDLASRHQSMAACIDWSHRLLTPHEQAIFRKLAVFRGGFPRSAFRAVAMPGDEPDDDAPCRALLSLTDRQLVRPAGACFGELRFGLLETTRAFAAERLGEHAADDAATREAHAAWCLDLAERVEASWQRTGTGVTLDRLDREHDNLRAALAWFDESRNAEGLLRLVTALCSFWNHSGKLAEADAWLTRATALSERTNAAADLRSMVLSWHGRLLVVLGDLPRARFRLEAALALRRATGNVEGIAYTSMHLSRLVAVEGSGDPTPCLEEARRLFGSIQHREGVAMALDALAEVAFQAGDDDRADTLARQAVDAAEEAGNALRTAVALTTRAQAATRRKRHDEALGLLARSLDLSLAIGFRYGVADSFAGIAATRHEGDHAPGAIRLLAAAAVIRDGLAAQFQFHEAQFQRTCADAPAWASGEMFQANWNAGLGLTLAEAVAEAGRIVQAPGSPDAALPPAAFGLSPREQDVLAQLAEGRSNAEIGQALGISSRTAAVHVSRILRKLEVNNRAAVVSVAIRHGLVAAG